MKAVGLLSADVAPFFDVRMTAVIIEQLVYLMGNGRTNHFGCVLPRWVSSNGV